jgi:hypothetical protein
VLVHIAVTLAAGLGFVGTSSGAFVTVLEFGLVDTVKLLNFVLIVGHNLLLIIMKARIGFI